jgi:Kdo2-lipid IVA lauroyltransferase/acyltransferase
MSKLVKKTNKKYPKWYVAARKAGQWVVAQLFFGLVGFLKLFPADLAINTFERLSRFFGMRHPRTETARRNLKRAFPDSSDGEIDDILGQMWGSLGRTTAEYAYLDAIFELKELEGPAVCFTAHMANWELLPVAAAAYGLNITALFRPPNNPFISRRVLAARRTAMGHLVPSKAGAAWALADIMREGGKVGVLVDQYYKSGVPVTFFGRPTLANPLVARLVRQFDCPVYPARCIRLPGGRFRIELQDRIDIPRDKNGKVDIAGLTGKVNDVVETWVREYPGQWLWLHNRWRDK